MPLVQNLEMLKKWAEDTVCSQVSLKVPDDDQISAGYIHDVMHPAVFVMAMPTKDKKPPKIKSTIPSILIELLEGESQPIQNKGRLQIRFSLSTWSSGEHGPDYFIPEEGVAGPIIGPAYLQWQGEEAQAHYISNVDGWKDVWSFADVAIREIQNAGIIGGELRLMEEEGLKFGQYILEDQILNAYPYWFAYILVSYEYGYPNNNSFRSDFL